MLKDIYEPSMALKQKRSSSTSDLLAEKLTSLQEHAGLRQKIIASTHALRNYRQMLHKIAEDLFSLPPDINQFPGETATVFAAMDFEKTLAVIVENCFPSAFVNAGTTKCRDLCLY